ncbi:hypothetical protein AB4Y96_09245 [Phyllobacterium sp. TAF24]|uniref:hypothetical protein n=1 Tax=Phyllobacterium sp. TAF24 TaxID=3233068 RepID=UPI003F9D02A6
MAALFIVVVVSLFAMTIWDISRETAQLYTETDIRMKNAAVLQQEREELDLFAQRSMARWSFWTVLVSALSVVVSTVALFGLFRSLSHTRLAITDARQIGEYEIQAYVHASKLELGSGAKSIILTCKNTGSTPASHFAVGAMAQKVKLGQVERSIRFDDLNLKVWSTLAANDELTVNLDVKNFNIVEEYVQGGSFLEDEVLLISGHIHYVTVFNHDHETQFAFFAHPRHKLQFRRPTSNLRSFNRIG